MTTTTEDTRRRSSRPQRPDGAGVKILRSRETTVTAPIALPATETPASGNEAETLPTPELVSEERPLEVIAGDPAITAEPPTQPPPLELPRTDQSITQAIEDAGGVQKPVAVSLIHESPTNPRKRFADMERLIESVRLRGVIQPILVRPHPAVPGEWELVAGARRLRAARAAGRSTIPVYERALSDLDVAECQVIENNQRKDVHPLEEADGFALLLERGHYTPKELAERISRSDSYIYQRLRLRDLSPVAREAFLDDRLDAARGLLIARLPAAIQPAALADLVNDAPRPLSFREAQEHVRRKFLLKVLEGGFSPDDPDLVPSAGACSTCPKRTTNDPSADEDLRAADLCLDGVCYGVKRAAEFQRRLDAGAKAIDAKKAEELFYNWGELRGGEYLELEGTARSESGKQKTWGEVLGPEATSLTQIVRDPAGKIRELAPKKAVIASLRGDPKRETWLSGIAPKRAAPEDLKAQADERQRARDREQAEGEELRKVMAGLAAFGERVATPIRVWRAVALGIVAGHAWRRGGEQLIARRGITVDSTTQDAQAALTAWVTKATEAELRGFCLELLVQEIYDHDEDVENVFGALGVSREALGRGEHKDEDVENVFDRLRKPKPAKAAAKVSAGAKPKPAAKSAKSRPKATKAKAAR